jgi:hypothetical protein
MLGGPGTNSFSNVLNVQVSESSNTALQTQYLADVWLNLMFSLLVKSAHLNLLELILNTLGASSEVKGELPLHQLIE